MEDKIGISFPNIGIENLMISREAFRIFDHPIYWYGIIIALAFLVCVLWAMKDAPKYELSSETIIDLILFAAPIAIICSRIYFVIFSWEIYSSDWKKIFYIRDGGLAIYGGIIGGIATAFFVAKYKKIPVLKFFDFCIPYVALGQAIGRWGNFFNQQAFGTNTTLPWGMISPTTTAYLESVRESLHAKGITVNPDMPVHPTFLYESLLCLATFAFLLWRRKKKVFNGEVFSLYFVIYCLGRAFIEGMRTDSLMLGNFRVSQMLSILLVVVFVVIIAYMRIKVKNEAVETAEAQPSRYAEVLKTIEDENSIDAKKQSDGLNENVSSIYINENNAPITDASSEDIQQSQGQITKADIQTDNQPDKDSKQEDKEPEENNNSNVALNSEKKA